MCTCASLNLDLKKKKGGSENVPETVWIMASATIGPASIEIIFLE